MITRCLAWEGGREALVTLGVPAGSPLVGNVAQLVDHKDHATLLSPPLWF